AAGAKDNAITLKNLTWCRSLTNSNVITDLFNESTAITLAEDLTGCEVKRAGSSQIALRFPGDGCTDKESFIPSTSWNKQWHIDGFHAEANGVPKGEVRNFSLLVGIMLNDVDDDFQGNLTVYPKSHHVTEQFFNESNFDQIKQNGLESLKGLPFSSPIQLKGKAGDVVLAHYNLAHNAGPNAGPNIRYAIYFRVDLRNGSRSYDSMKNIWLDWKGMHQTVARENKSKGLLLQQARNNISADSITQHANQLNQTLSQAKLHFEKKEWEQAQSLYQQIVHQDDFDLNLKLGSAYTYGPQHNVSKGEQYLLRCITLSPSYPHAYNVLAHNYLRQGSYEKVLSPIDTLVECKDSKLVANSFWIITDALSHVQDGDFKMKQIQSKIQSNHPSIADQFQSQVWNQYRGALAWKEFKKWEVTPNKKLDQGIQLLHTILQYKPRDYWANLLLGGYPTWMGDGSDCEASIRKAIEIDPKIPNGHMVLVQNLIKRNKQQEAVVVIASYFDNYVCDTVNTQPDHANKVMDMIKAFKKLTNSDARYSSLLNTCLTKYLSLRDSIMMI
ncbi:ectD, partial [Acrasis kona]